MLHSSTILSLKSTRFKFNIMSLTIAKQDESASLLKLFLGMPLNELNEMLSPAIKHDLCLSPISKSVHIKKQLNHLSNAL